MCKLDLGAVAEFSRGVLDYSLSYEDGLGLTAHLAYHDSGQKRWLRFVLESSPITASEAFWDGLHGFGHRLTEQAWIPISDPPIPSVLPMLADLVSTTEPSNVHEDESNATLKYKFDDDINLHENLIPALKKGKLPRRYVNRMMALLKEIDISLTVEIDKKRNRIESADLSVQLADHSVSFSLALEYAERPQPRQPRDFGRAWADGEPIPMFALLLQLPRIGGWATASHQIWTQKTIDFLGREDSLAGRYSEIYGHFSRRRFNEGDQDPVQSGDQLPPDPPGVTQTDYLFDHPLVIGSRYEDHCRGFPSFYSDWFQSDPNFKKNPTYYFPQSSTKYDRSFNHYGGGKEGLEHRHYFWLYKHVTPCEAPAPGKQRGEYYSARDWGYGGNRIGQPDLNRLTFVEAIRQYNRYTGEGKRNAYLMLGHVLHLLQDVGQPDHAARYPHPGSSLDGEAVFSGVCPAMAITVGAHAAASSAWLGWLGALFGGIAAVLFLRVCNESYNPHDVGFEKLIGDRLRWRDDDIAGTLGNLKSVEYLDYDLFFSKMAEISIDAAQKRKIEVPIGLDDFFIHGMWFTVHGLNPQIDPRKVRDYSKYVDLAREIVPEIIRHGVGFLKYFYSIVHYPPILEEIAVVEFPANHKPVRFGIFDANQAALDEMQMGEECVRYHRRWYLMGQDGKPWRECRDVNTARPPLRVARFATHYLFLRFGPTVFPEKGREMDLRVILEYPGAAGALKSQEIPMTAERIDEDGFFYWGEFFIGECRTSVDTLRIRVEGADKEPHAERPVSNGRDLDSVPSTVAVVDADDGPSFGFSDYSPGADENHLLEIEGYHFEAGVQERRVTITQRTEIPLKEPQQRKPKGVLGVGELGGDARTADANSFSERRISLRCWRIVPGCPDSEELAVPMCPYAWRVVDVLRSGSKPFNAQDEGLSLAIDNVAPGVSNLVIGVDWNRVGIKSFVANIIFDPGTEPKREFRWAIEVNLEKAPKFKLLKPPKNAGRP